MKSLNNPFVAGSLAVAACGFFAWNVVGPIWARHRASNPAPEPPGAAAAAAPLPVSHAAIPNPGPTAAADSNYDPIDVAAIQTQLPRWFEVPRRDPFEVVVKAKTVAQKDVPRAEDLLRLQAIWRQSGRQLAVVNQLIVTEGDLVAGYSVERIENDFISVKGSNGLERVEYRAQAVDPQPAPRPAVPAAVPVPANSPAAKPTQTVLRPANIPT